MSKVVVAKYSGNGQRGLAKEEYRLLLGTGLTRLSGEKEVKTALQKYFPKFPKGVIGIKTNCIARTFNSTPTALADALSDLLTQAGFDENDIVIWERTSRELSKAGYTLNASSSGRRCLGTDTNGLGYSGDFYNSGDVSSLVSRILTDMVDYNINLPVLKDHSIAGLSAGMKNMYGAINNPNKYHDNNCDPFCAHVSNLEPIRKKNRLAVIDAVQVQYDRGPGFVAEYTARYNGIIISDDPVAADRVCLEILEQLRKVNGLPSLEKVGRPVKYLASAQQLGLGTADMKQIDVDVAVVDKNGQARVGGLF
jgi:uncharacterized protein (DUF362 family)